MVVLVGAYEIAIIVIALCFFPVTFTISITDLEITKYMVSKKIRLMFNSKRNIRSIKRVISTAKNTYTYYKNYELPDLPRG